MPRLLRGIVIDRHRPIAPCGTDNNLELMLGRDLGSDIWTRLPEEQCRRLGMVVVDRIQTRLAGLPEPLLQTPLPDPTTALTYTLERRTANTLRRALTCGEAEEACTLTWTLKRYLGIRRFGGRAVVDLLAAVEANAGQASGAIEIATDRAADDALHAIARRLPISERRAGEDLAAEGAGGVMDLRGLVRSAVSRGRTMPFHVMEIGGARVAVHLSQVTLVRDAYRMASRSIQAWGAVTIRAIAARLRADPTGVTEADFVERVLADLPAFRWIERGCGWFWFVGRSNPLVEDLVGILSATPRIPIRQLWKALFRERPGPWPSPEAMPRICAEVPGVVIVGDEVILDGGLDRSIDFARSRDPEPAIPLA